MTAPAAHESFADAVPIEIAPGQHLVLNLRARRAVPLAAAGPQPISIPPTSGVRFELAYEQATDTLRPRAFALLGGAEPLLVHIGGDGRGEILDVPPGSYDAVPIFSPFFTSPGWYYVATAEQQGYRSVVIPRTARQRRDVKFDQADQVTIKKGDELLVTRRIMRFDSDGSDKGIDEIAVANIYPKSSDNAVMNVVVVIVRDSVVRATPTARMLKP